MKKLNSGLMDKKIKLNHLNIKKIKIRAWNKIKKHINKNSHEFDQLTISLEITNDYHLMIWCNVDHEKNNEKYFAISIRQNLISDISYDEYYTKNTTKKELFTAIDRLMIKKSTGQCKELLREKRGF